jgi:mono/diheme cytochrome c family protein
MSWGRLKILYAEGIACPACTAQVTAIAFRSKLEDGAVYLSIERFCVVEGDGKELAKLWVRMKTRNKRRSWLVFRRLMNRIMPACAIAAVTLVTQFPILAQPVERDGISSGRQIAAKICGNCHEISPTMSPKTAVGPRFDDIANLPSTTALSLKVFLRSSHKRMRNLTLSGADSDDVIAYILSLKRR